MSLITRGFTSNNMITQGLGISIVIAAWKEIKSFIVYIRKTVLFNNNL